MNKKAGNAEEKQSLGYVFFWNMITQHVFSFRTPQEAERFHFLSLWPHECKDSFFNIVMEISIAFPGY